MNIRKSPRGPKWYRSLTQSVSFLIVLNLAMLTVAAVLFNVTFWDWPSEFWDWLREGETNSATIRNVGFAIAGLFALPFAVWRSLVAGRQADAALTQAVAAQLQVATAQQSLQNDRFQKGAEMLGDIILSVRVGGIYALRSLVESHPEEYYMQIMPLLCAFIRYPPEDPSFELNDNRITTNTLSDKDKNPLRQDVAIAVEAIAVRDEAHIKLERDKQFLHDLTNANLRRLVITMGNLSNINLSGADLTESLLVETNLYHGLFTFGNLSDAVIAGADLTDADFGKTDLSGTKFSINRYSKDGEHVGKLAARNLTQVQLDRAVADPNDPLILDGVTDSVTGEQLFWRGGTPENGNGSETFLFQRG